MTTVSADATFDGTRFGPLHMFRWPLLSVSPSAPIQWICRAAAGLVFIHLLSITYYAKEFVGLSEPSWLRLYLVLVAALFVAYLRILEPRVLRAFRYVAPFDLIDLTLLVLFSSVGSDLLARAWSGTDRSTRSTLLTGLCWGLLGLDIGLSFQFVFRWIRNVLVSLPHQLSSFDRYKVRLLVVLSVMLAPFALLPRYNQVDPVAALGIVLIASGFGLALGMTLDAMDIWEARLRTRSYLVVFPKPHGPGDDKHKIEVALSLGRLGSALSLIRSSPALSPRDRYVLLATHAYLASDSNAFVDVVSNSPTDSVTAATSDRLLCLRANYLFREGKHDEAIRMLTSRTELSKNPYIQMNLALFYGFLGKLRDGLLAAKIAHDLDSICPAITAVFVCLSFEGASALERHNRVEEWLTLVDGAMEQYRARYQDGSVLPQSQRWRSMLYLTMTEAMLLLEKGDRTAIGKAETLLGEAENMAPFDPWVRRGIANYFHKRSQTAGTGLLALATRRAYELKANWHDRSARRLLAATNDVEGMSR